MTFLRDLLWCVGWAWCCWRDRDRHPDTVDRHGG